MDFVNRSISHTSYIGSSLHGDSGFCLLLSTSSPDKYANILKLVLVVRSGQIYFLDVNDLINCSGL